MGAVKQILCELIERGQSGDPSACWELLIQGYGSLVSDCGEEALAYCIEHRWAIIPQQPGSKKPCVRWQEYKDERRPPNPAELANWYVHWPNGGVILLLGPVSGVLAVDVDGREAHRTLVRRLGRIPDAPRSSRGKKYRYHLLFRHPKDIETNARYTPWHANLEFRGHGGYVVVPPSLHQSGNRYRWAAGRSPDEMELPKVPKPILEALKEREERKQQRAHKAQESESESSGVIEVRTIPGVTRATQQFLTGQYANGPGWNRRLFSAACDLAGNCVPEAMATELLLGGARPWNAEEQEKATATIRSAYAVDRVPGRLFAPQQTKRSQPQTTIIEIDS